MIRELAQRQWNADCPFCGGEGKLVAQVRTVYLTVPLHGDGYSLGEVEPDMQDVEEVTCSECRADVGSFHYFHHGEGGEECDPNTGRCWSAMSNSWT